MMNSVEFAGTSASNDKKAPLPKEPEPTVTQPLLYPSQLTAPPAATTSNAGGVTVYHYVHPVTQERVDSLLPPTHPEMQCLQYGHMAHTKFGWLGIFAAIFWFPLGVGCLLLDRKVQCDRYVLMSCLLSPLLLIPL